MAARVARLAVERRLAGFMGEVRGLPYSLGAVKLLRPAAHAAVVPPAVAAARATAPLDASRAATRVLASALPPRPTYFCSELLACAYARMGLLPLPRAPGIPPPLADPAANWPNCWAQGGPVERLLPAGVRLDRLVLLDPRPPLPVQLVG